MAIRNIRAVVRLGMMTCSVEVQHTGQWRALGWGHVAIRNIRAVVSLEVGTCGDTQHTGSGEP